MSVSDNVSLRQCQDLVNVRVRYYQEINNTEKNEIPKKSEISKKNLT